MKYSILTKEQLEALHHEFAIFLATQQIDAKEWQHINDTKPEVAHEEIVLFSNLVWEKALSKTKYLEHQSEQHLNLFKCNDDSIARIYIKINYPSIDLTTDEGINWLMNNLNNEKIEIFRGSKTYQSERNKELYDLIAMGSEITEGELYNAIVQLIA